MVSSVPCGVRGGRPDPDNGGAHFFFFLPFLSFFLPFFFAMFRTSPW